jgi:hypothetical protein
VNSEKNYGDKGCGEQGSSVSLEEGWHPDELSSGQGKLGGYAGDLRLGQQMLYGRLRMGIMVMVACRPFITSLGLLLWLFLLPFCLLLLLQLYLLLVLHFMLRE